MLCAQSISKLKVKHSDYYCDCAGIFLDNFMLVMGFF